MDDREEAELRRVYGLYEDNHPRLAEARMLLEIAIQLMRLNRSLAVDIEEKDG